MPTMPIHLDDNSKAFYAGVSAGGKASETLKIDSDRPYEQRLGFFWLHVGMALHTQLPAATKEQVELFVRGAALQQPEQHRPFTLRVATIDTPAFGDPEDGDGPALAGIARILSETASRLREGFTEGPLRDTDGAVVGEFAYHCL